MNFSLDGRRFGYAVVCCVICAAAFALAGCAGGRDDPPPTGPPPDLPWQLSMYDSGRASPTAEGTLTRSGTQYVIELAPDGLEAEISVVGMKDVVREGDTVSIPMPATQSRQETFVRADLERAMRALNAGTPMGIRSADEERIYLLRPAKVHEARLE